MIWQTALHQKDEKLLKKGLTREGGRDIMVKLSHEIAAHRRKSLKRFGKTLDKRN